MGPEAEEAAAAAAAVVELLSGVVRMDFASTHRGRDCRAEQVGCWVRIHLQVVGVDHGGSPDNRRVHPGCRNRRTLAAGDAASVPVLSYANWMMAICGGVVLRAKTCVEWARGGLASTQSQRVQFRLLYSPTNLLLPPPPSRNQCTRHDCQ